MRKLYALLAGLFISLASTQTIAQQTTADLANFTYAINASDNNVVFTNTSVIGAEPGNRRAFWSFGDGSSQWSDQFDNAKHDYPVAGTYTVCLRIYRYATNSNDPILSAEICKTIIIEPLCRADFEFRDSITNVDPLKHLVHFWAIPFSNSDKPASVCWNFGDGTDTCINISSTAPPTNLLAIQHTYYKQGPYNVCVKIKYQNGCVAEKCKLIELKNPGPDNCSADLERLPVTTSNNLLTVVYKALPRHSSNKKPISICWSFGDGRDTCIKYLNLRNGRYVVTHTYRQPGLYEVCVKILYYGGCEAKKCKPIQVGRPDSCSANFERLPVISANDPLQAHFKALLRHNNNKKPAAICWYFGDGKDTCVKYEPTYTGTYAIAHKYKEPGRYEVCVKIFYYGGCEAKWCKQIIIDRPDRCSADFEQIPTTANTPLTTYFHAIPKHNNNKKPETICWKFGDGKDTCIKYEPGSTGQYTIAHHYLQPGQYEVCVYILYAGGCEAKLCKVIRIGEPDKCSADFERSPLQDNDPLTIGLKAIPWNSNSHKPAAICWYFGDGKDSCIKYEPTYAGTYTIAHRYKEPGQYEVCVKIFYYGGCEAKNCKFIVVPPPQNTCAVKLFEIVPSVTSLVRGFFVSTSSTPDKKPERICWYFGDGTDTCIQTDTPNPTSLPDNLIRHTYPAPGVYKACVKVLFHGGCIAYDCVEVVIRSATDICGGYMIDSLTGPRTFKFKGFSIHNRNDEAVGYRWTFGDGSTAAGQEVKHEYKEGGTYEVCLYIKTRLGCETKVCKAVRVPGNNQPTLQLSPNPVINTLHVQFFSTRTEQVSIKIVSSSGITVRSYTRNVTVGQNSWDIELGSLVQGIYTFVLQSPNQLASAIFLKQ